MSDPPCSSSQLVPARTSGLCRPQSCPAARLMLGPGVYWQQTVAQWRCMCTAPICSTKLCLLSVTACRSYSSCWELLLLAATSCEEKCQSQDS